MKAGRFPTENGAYLISRVLLIDRGEHLVVSASDQCIWVLSLSARDPTTHNYYRVNIGLNNTDIHGERNSGVQSAVAINSSKTSE